MAVGCSMDGNAFCFVTVTAETKFSMAHEIVLLNMNNVQCPPVGQECECPDSLRSLSSYNIDENNVHHILA